MLILILDMGMVCLGTSIRKITFISTMFNSLIDQLQASQYKYSKEQFDKDAEAWTIKHARSNTVSTCVSLENKFKSLFKCYSPTRISQIPGRYQSP